MPIYCRWATEEKQTICIEYAQPWTWNDVFAHLDQLKSMLHSVETPVCIVADLRCFGAPPVQSFPAHARRISDLFIGHNVSSVVLVAASRALRILLAHAIQIFSGAPDRYTVVETLEQAHAHAAVHITRQTRH